MPKYRIEVDSEICEGFGDCVELCSDYFSLSEGESKSKRKGIRKVVEDWGNIRNVLEIEEVNRLKSAKNTCTNNVVKVEGI